MGDEIRLYEFNPRIAIYGFDRKEALSVLNDLLKQLEGLEPTVAQAMQNPTMDKNLLAKAGIDREGRPFDPTLIIPFNRHPPAWMVREQERREREGNRGDSSE